MKADDSDWSPEALDRIGPAEELQIAGRRANGTLRAPITIWSVAVGGSVYVRAVAGRAAGWHRGTQIRREGQITVEGTTYDVVFSSADPALGAEIDEAFRAKYVRWPDETDSLLTGTARESTIRIQPAV